MSFECPLCKRISHHPKDEKNRYCSACQRFFPEKKSSIENLIALEKVATPGPWYYDFSNQDIESRQRDYYRIPICREENLHERIRHKEEFKLGNECDPSRSAIDMELIAEMRNILPKVLPMLAIVEEMVADYERDFRIGHYIVMLEAHLHELKKCST